MSEARETKSFRLPLMADSNERAETPAPGVCRLLRTKMSFGSFPKPERLGDSTTAVYWCLLTMETFGADDDYVHPHKCTEGRRCFASPPVV